MIGEWARRWWAGRSARRNPAAYSGAPVAVGEAPPPPAGAGPPDPRLEVYLDQIAGLPAADRAIIIGVLQGILDEETAYERRLIAGDPPHPGTPRT